MLVSKGVLVERFDAFHPSGGSCVGAVHFDFLKALVRGRQFIVHFGSCSQSLGWH